MHKPNNPGNYVTDFSHWVYSLYNKSYPSSITKDAQGEKYINAKRLSSQFKPPNDWKLLYKDLGAGNKNAKKINKLQIKEKYLVGKPDLVLQNIISKQIIIVEVKISDAEIPSDGWPDIRSQLWAYSLIDDWADNKDIILVGEIWGFEKIKIDGITRSEPFVRQSISWRKGDYEFSEQNRLLFKAFGGVIIE